MYCEYAECHCLICMQIEGACEDCELKNEDSDRFTEVYIEIEEEN